MRQHRFFIGQDLGSKMGGLGDASATFEFDPEQVDSGLENAVVAHQKEIVRQWKKVFRYEAGSSVILFDGKIECLVKIIEFPKPKETVRLVIEKKLRDVGEVDEGDEGKNRHPKLWLALAILKGEHTDMVVEKATELGVSGIILIHSERVVKKGANLERLQKISIEAAEQCGRLDVPSIITDVSLEDLMTGNDEKKFTNVNFHRKIVLDMGGQPLTEILDKKEEDDDGDTLIVVGPEGGWSENEQASFKKYTDEGAVVVASLGENVLRAETAAIVSVAIFCLK